MDPLLQNFPTFVTCLARSGRRKYLIVVVTHISADMDGSKSCIEAPNKKNNPCKGGSLWQNKMRQTKLILDFELYLHNVLVLTERQVRPCRPGLLRRSSVSWNYLPGCLAQSGTIWHATSTQSCNNAISTQSSSPHSSLLLFDIWPPLTPSQHSAQYCLSM